MWLACRHHTHELILKGVFEKCCNLPSSGPDIQIFRKFQNLWATFDKKSYTTMLDDEAPVQGFLEEQRVAMVNYIQNVLKDGSHPREDYKELLQLSLLYLGVGIMMTSDSGSQELCIRQGGWQKQFMPLK